MMADPTSPELSSVPTLSIIIPAYNVAPYISEAVNSALDQSFSDLEVVVVDDGSTDATSDILRSLQAERRDPRLRIVTRKNGGLSAARNTGIDNARGEFLGFLDSDDVWLPRKAEAQLKLMNTDPAIGISFSHSEYIKEDGTRTGSILLAGKGNPTLQDLIRRNHLGNGSTPILRRACFEAAGKFREELRSCEDYEMWCRIVALTSYRAALVAEPLTLYRLRETSLCFNFAKFLENADLAMVCLRRTIKGVPAAVFRAGHAEHYRIAAWKAASTGQDRAAWTLLTKAIRLWPLLILTDFRVAGTGVSLALPASLRSRFANLRKLLHRSASETVMPA